MGGQNAALGELKRQQETERAENLAARSNSEMLLREIADKKVPKLNDSLTVLNNDFKKIMEGQGTQLRFMIGILIFEIILAIAVALVALKMFMS